MAKWKITVIEQVQMTYEIEAATEYEAREEYYLGLREPIHTESLDGEIIGIVEDAPRHAEGGGHG